jgi:hypothetical protein
LSDPKAQVLEDVVISNARHNEPLKSGSFFKNTDTERRMIFTDRNMHTIGILQPKGKKKIFLGNKSRYYNGRWNVSSIADQNSFPSKSASGADFSKPFVCLLSMCYKFQF